jgi:hypothetical protein
MSRKAILDLSGGVQSRSTSYLMASNQVKGALNAEFISKIGSATGRMGSAVQSTVVASQRVLNILQWIKNDGTVKYFACVGDGAGSPKLDIFVNSAVFAGTWSKSLEDLTDAKDVFYTNFANKMVECNGVEAVKWFDGSSWAEITNAPATGKFPEVYNQRLYILTETGFLYYSDVVNATGDDFTTTTWANRGINPNDGEKAKMLIRHRGRLVIFKEESCYRYDGANEPEPVITVGTHSSKSVVLLKDLFFHHPTGIYRMNVGEPVNISGAIKKFLDGMSSSNWEHVASGRDLENVYFWIGDVTISDPLEYDYGRVYTDVVLVFNVYSESWTVFTNWNARTWFYDKTSGLTYFGTSKGKIVRINYGYADVDGAAIAPISFEIIFNNESFDYPEKDKEIGSITVLGKFDSDVVFDDSYDGMETRGKLNDQKTIGNVICKELWIGVNEEYSELPPRIEGIIYDNVKLLDDAN